MDTLPILFVSREDLEMTPTWGWRYLPASRMLTQSVPVDGILSPVWVLKKGGRLVLVDGHRRLSLVPADERLPARIVPDVETACRWKATLDMIADPYSELEKAALVARVLDEGLMTPTTVSEQLLPILKLKPGLRTVTACRASASLPPDLFQILLVRKAPMVFAERLARESDGDLQALTDWLVTRHLSLNRIMTAVDDILTIRDREDMPVSEILSQFNGNDALERLASRRSPRSMAFQQRLAARLARYPGWLSFSRDLEGDAYTFQATIRGPEDIRSARQVLERMETDVDLFAPLQELTEDD